MMDAMDIMIAGKTYENATALMTRLRITVGMIKRLIKEGMPAPMKLGRVQWFDRAAVDDWLVNRQ